MKNSNDTIGNRTRDLLTCSAVPQPTVPPRSPYLPVPTINVTTILVFELSYHDFCNAFDFQLQGEDCLHRIHLQEEQDLSRNKSRDDDVAAHNVIFENCSLLGYYALRRSNSLRTSLDP